jgi:hypothetical protein
MEDKNKYGNLRAKTIFDFCKDDSILGEIIGHIRRPDEKQRYIEYFEKNPGNNASTMICYAEAVNNEELVVAIRKEFADELSSLFNE